MFTLLGIVAGLLITASSVLATCRARLLEAVHYRILGASSRFVLQVFALEGALVGLASGVRLWRSHRRSRGGSRPGG